MKLEKKMQKQSSLFIAVYKKTHTGYPAREGRSPIWTLKAVTTCTYTAEAYARGWLIL